MACKGCGVQGTPPSVTLTIGIYAFDKQSTASSSSPWETPKNVQLNVCIIWYTDRLLKPSSDPPVTERFSLWYLAHPANAPPKMFRPEMPVTPQYSRSITGTCRMHHRHAKMKSDGGFLASNCPKRGVHCEMSVCKAWSWQWSKRPSPPIAPKDRRL